MSSPELYVLDLETVELLMLGTGWEEDARKHEKVGPQRLFWAAGAAVTEEGLEALLYTDWGNLTSCVLAHPGTTSDVTTQIETVLRCLDSGQILIPQPTEVRDYLLRYPDMTELLLSVSELAWARFGTDAQLSAEVYHDPEIEDEYLTLYVRQDTYDDHVLDMIDEIRVRYESALIGKSGWLLVTTDFQPPE